MKISSIVLLIALPFFGLAQSRKDAAREIETLKSGALFVRLKTGDLQAAALERSGNKSEAEEYRKKQNEENKAIVQAFLKNFRFCPVYFFYSSCSQKIRSKDFNGCLLDKNLQTDSARITPVKGYMTAEFGKSDKQQIEGLIVMNADFEQLAAPFPFLIRKYKSLIVTRSYDEMVQQLETDLQELEKKK
jgi:hypothetical protein